MGPFYVIEIIQFSSIAISPLPSFPFPQKRASPDRVKKISKTYPAELIFLLEAVWAN